MILLSDILSKVTEKEIMEHYYSQSIIDKKPVYRNMMRNDDKGTCYFNWYRGKYYLVDRARGRDANFDCFMLIQYLNGCNFNESLQIINKDLGLGLSDDYTSNPGRRTIKKKKVNQSEYYQRKINYQIKSRKWNEDDVNYWNQFNISIDTLVKYNVIPVNSYKSDSGESFKFSLRYKYNKINPCYAYVFRGKKSTRVKLYKPLDKQYKWSGNINSDDIFGYEQLIDKGKELYICSGLKDLMCLHEMGYNAIAPQSESSKIKKEIIDELKTRFNNIIILFDNDNTGYEMSIKFAKEYDCYYKLLPQITGIKDIAELVQYKQINKAKSIINNLEVHGKCK